MDYALNDTNDILKVVDLRKEFGATVALKDVSISFEEGKIHALIGKNGSGKSTLVNIITGGLTPTKGQIFLNGKKIKINNTSAAFNLGIVAVHQENSLVDSLSVAENVYIGRWPSKNFIIDWKQIYKQAKEFIEEIAPYIDPKSIVSSLSVGQKQVVEIIKAVSSNPHILILDEPTSALSMHETDVLFDVIRQLKKKGKTIIYITHRLNELDDLVDTVTVLRDGIYIDKKNISEIAKSDITKMMFGDIEIKSNNEKKDIDYNEDNIVLSVKNLVLDNMSNSMSFDLYKGEILGIAGMLGSGRTELLRSIFGLYKFSSGNIYVHGKKIDKVTPEIMKNLGIAFASEDRHTDGLIHELSIHFNLCLAAIKKIQNFPFITEKMEEPYVDRQIKNLDIKVESPMLKVSSLSGGNQQKVVIGNWLNNAPDIFLLDEPSRGIDIKAKQYIFDIIFEQSLHGLSSIIVSSELEELVTLCDRILIMKSASIVEEYKSTELTNETIYNKCMEK